MQQFIREQHQKDPIILDNKNTLCTVFTSYWTLLSQSLRDTFYTFNSTKSLMGGKNNKSWNLTDASVGV